MMINHKVINDVGIMMQFIMTKLIESWHCILLIFHSDFFLLLLSNTYHILI